MTFSYLRAYANTKKNSLLISYLISGAVYTSLTACLLLPTTSVLLTFQLFLVCMQLVWSLILFISGSISETVLKEGIRLKKYRALIDFVQVYNFREKYGIMADLYTLIGIGLVIANMLVLGWIWQPILFLFFTAIGSINAYSTINRLPQIVEESNLKRRGFCMILEPEEPADEQDIIAFLESISTECPRGANFEQAKRHMFFCKAVEKLSKQDLIHIAKALSALYIGSQITVAVMARQEFSGGFPTNIDGV